MSAASDALTQFARLVRTGKTRDRRGAPRLGIDLGTSNIVLAVVDDADRPIAGGWRHSTVVRDGVVVDWTGAVNAVREILEALQHSLRHEFTEATLAIPPGVDHGTVQVFRNVAEACGLEASAVVDEPVAAATALGLDDGAVIDIGHGTTGVSVLRDGRIDCSVDEATGGHHMTLVISGALGLDYDAAEDYKRDPSHADTVFGLIRPTLEKMATIAAGALHGHEVTEVHLVGGSSSFPRAAEVFAQVLGRPVQRPTEPLFPTPLGTALWRRHD